MIKIFEEYDEQFDKGLKKYIGRPLKSLLKDLNGKLKIYIDIDGVDRYGSSGASTMVNQVEWQLADLEILDASAKDSKYYDLKVKVKGE